MKTEWEYVLQRQTMRENYGHYTPVGDWEDLAVYKSWKTAMRHLTRTSARLNKPFVTCILRVQTRKKVEEGA